MTVLQQPLIERIEQVPSVLESLSVQRLNLVLDESGYELSGAKAAIEPFLQGMTTTRFTQFELNPKLGDVERGIKAYRKSDPDLVVAIGGGTAIDLAKLIGTLAVQSGPAREIATGHAAINVAGKPLMAIPTTAGTGSEATHFAVVYVDGKKHSVAHPTLLPDYAVVDPRLTESLPKQMTAATGLDAFCQAIESIWSVGATVESIEYSTEAARLAYENIEAATNAPTLEARRAMCRASHLAGKAINITKTTGPHAISYGLTSRHGVPHGMAVAMTLAPMLAFNAGVTDSDCNDPRGAASVQNRIARIVRLLGANTISQAGTSINDLLTRIDCPRTMGAVGVKTSDEIKGIADSVNVERLSNNPRQASHEQLFDILKQLDSEQIL